MAAVVLMLFPTATLTLPTSASTPAHRSFHDWKSHKFCAHRPYWFGRCGAFGEPTQCDLNPNAEQGRLRNEFDTLAARLLMKEHTILIPLGLLLNAFSVQFSLRQQ